jgi:hypothetical protein
LLFGLKVRPQQWSEFKSRPGEAMQSSRPPLKLAELIEREFGGFVPPKMFDD